MLTINGEEWRVVSTSANHPMLQRNDGSFAIGACNDITKTIYIVEELPPMLFKKVLSHEITHAAMFSYNVPLSIEQEEIVADLIATYGQEIISMTNRIFCRLKHK